MNIIEKIKSIPNLRTSKGASEKSIQEAEESLNLIFPKEYRDYVKEFGLITFDSIEWTGVIQVDNYLNVVTATKEIQDYDEDFPLDCFVLENLGIDGVFTICDEKGKVYEYQYGSKTLLANSICEYLDMCLKNN